MSYQDLLGDSYKYDPDYHRVAEFLGLDRFIREDVEVARKVSYIYDWAKERAGRDDVDSVFSEMNRLQKKLGVHSIGEDLLAHLYRATRLDSGRRLDKKRDEEVKEREHQQIESRIKIENEGKEWRSNIAKEDKYINKQNSEIARQLERDVAKAQRVTPEKVERIKEIVPEHTSEKIKV